MSSVEDQCEEGHDVPTGASFCPTCGSPILGASDESEDDEDYDDGPVTAGRKRDPVNFIVVGLGALALIAMGAYYLSQQDDRDADEDEISASQDQAPADDQELTGARLCIAEVSETIDRTRSGDDMAAFNEYGAGSTEANVVIQITGLLNMEAIEYGEDLALDRAIERIDTACSRLAGTAGDPLDLRLPEPSAATRERYSD